MGDLSQIANAADKVGTGFARKAMDAFAIHYNERKDEMFSQAHGNSDVHDYDRHNYARVAFKDKSEIELFMQDMQSQGISAVGMPFKLNGQYVAEIPVVQEDGRKADEVIEDFRSRTYIDTQSETSTAYERTPQRDIETSESIMDALVVNHLDEVGVAIHKVQQAYSTLTSYGYLANDNIYRSGLNSEGDANPYVNTGKAKMATVIHGDTVIMDGKVVTDEKIIENVLEQHKERLEKSGEILSHIGDTISRQEKEQLASATSYVNKQADLIATYEKRIESGEALSLYQRDEYDKAKQVISDLEHDMGRTIDIDHHITTQEMNAFNQSTLQKIEEAGIDVVRSQSKVFDADKWNKTDIEEFSNIGLSAATHSLIYDINADAKQLSLKELNAEAILNNQYRQDYAVTTSTDNVQTVKDPNTIFGAWTLGSLEDISNKFNSDNITLDKLTESKLKENFTDTEAELVKDTISSYNDGIMQEAVEKAMQDIDPSLSSTLENIMAKTASVPSEYAFSNSDTLQNLTDKYDTTRKEMISGAFAENPNLEKLLSQNNISTQDLIGNSAEAERKLDLFMQGQGNSADVAALRTLRTDISALNAQQITETNSFLSQSFNKERTDKILNSIKENPELSTIFATRGITVEALASGADGVGDKLNRLIDEHKGAELFKPLVQLRDDIDKLNLEENKAVKPQNKGVEISSYKDLLDGNKSGALVAEKFKLERESFVNGVFSSNQELAKTISLNGITVNDLITDASGTTEKLNKLISETKDPALSKQLIALKTDLAQNFAAEDRMKTELAEKIQGNVDDMSIRLRNLTEKDSRSLSIVIKNVNAVRIEKYLASQKNLAFLMKKSGINLKGLTSEQILSKLAELRQKKEKALARGGNLLELTAELEIIKKAEADFKKISEEEKTFAKKLSTSFELSEFDKNMVSGNGKLWKDLQNVSWLKGKGLVDGFMTPEKLLDINALFLKKSNELGFKFVGATGGFNIKALQKLNNEDLKALGITSEIRNSLVEINKKGAFGKRDELKSFFAAASQGLAFFIKNVDGNAESWRDVQEFKANIQKGVKYTQNTITNIRRLKNIRPQDLHIFRKGGAQNLINQWRKPIEPKKPPKPKKRSSSKPMTVKQKARQEKYAEKLKKKLTKTRSRQNGWWTQINKRWAAAKKKAIEKLAQTAIGKAFIAAQTAITGAVSVFLLYYIAGAAILALGVQVVMIVGCLVICLVDTIKGAFDIGNWLAPQTYQDTVAYSLYQDLLCEENRYVAELANTPDYAYDNRNSITYGFDGKDLQSYLADFKNSDGYARLLYVTDNGGDIRINPFWREGYVTAESNTDYLTTLDKFDGNHTYDITTNLNYYNIIEDEEANKYDPVYGISNGHTSNIKDIIAMTDIMYQMEATDSDDETMTSVLGMSPHQLDWDNFWTTLGNGFKTIGDFFCNLCATIFQGEEWKVPHTDVNGISYNTVKTYAINLFELTHQQYLYLSVDYCDKDRKVYNKDGSEVSFESGTEVEYGICANPVLNSFKVKLDPSKSPDSPEPYVEREDGSIKFLDAKNSDGTPWFDISVSVENNLTSSEVSKICLWDDMPTEAGIHVNGVDVAYGTTDPSFWSRITSNNCWHQSGTPETHDEYLYGSAGSGWYKGRPSARRAAEKNCWTNIKYQYDILAAQGKLPETYYIIQEDVAIEYKYTYNTIAQSSVKYSGASYDIDFDDGETWYSCSIDGELKIYTLKITTYIRDCKGHTFEYCGGHVSTHEQGNVFSVTNEQLAVPKIYEEGKEPAALYTEFHNGSGVSGNTPYTSSLYKGSHTGDFEIDRRYDNIIGKVNKSEVDYRDAYTAAASGGCVSPVQDIYQGSIVSQGLNIVCEGDGYNGWGEGIVIQQGMISYCRDIFDCDCIILKGRNVFPFTDHTKYEGWTADNMSLVINRVATDWYEIYGFDIATEIGAYNYALSLQDIEMLTVGLEKEYGTQFTDDRKELIEALLSYVGRGHYTMHHHPFDYSTSYSSDQFEEANHGYLAYLCSSTNTVSRTDASGKETLISYSASCTAGNEVDIGNFVLNYIGKKFGRDIGGCYSTLEGYYDVTNLLPADIVTHNAYDLKRNDFTLDVNLGSGDVNGELLNDFHLKQQDVMYVGTFSDASIQAMKDYLKTKLDDEVYQEYIKDEFKLSSGQILTAGMPICIDLNQMGIYSGLRLRTEGSSENLYSFLSRYLTEVNDASDSDSTNTALNTTYYWLIHPDSRTKAFKAETLINPAW